MDPVGALIGLAGIGITWWASRYYYQRSSQDLVAQLEKLRRDLTEIARQDPAVKLERNDKGVVIGGQLIQTQMGQISVTGGTPVVSQGQP
jgi:hypothetical protein